VKSGGRRLPAGASGRRHPEKAKALVWFWIIDET
jgi:hypothetical protein